MSDSPVDPAPHTDPEPAEPPVDDWAGAPLRSTLLFLAVPGTLALAILLFQVHLPALVLYGIAGVLGLVLLGRMFRDPEWLLAVFVLYIPLNRLFVAPLAMGLNGTNVLMLLLLLAWIARASREGRPLLVPMPCSRLVGLWLGAILLSVLTAGFTFGFGTILTTNGGDLRQSLDNVVVFFAFLHLVRDGAQARRVVVYMMIGAVVVLALGLNEWLEKRFMDTIEKARLLGPQLQPNDYGAFLVYIAGPFLGLFLLQLRRPRAWLLVPFFALLARILLATFSRGAFIGAALVGVTAGYVRGRWFLLVNALLAAALLAFMPELVPSSLSTRMGQTTQESSEGELDASSQTRIVLWKAAVAMSLESPILGKGFKAFPRLKARYTEVDVDEADNHNMFLYIASQMGIPALLLFLWLLYRTYRLGVGVYRGTPDVFGRAVGMGGAAMVAGVLGVNMFGSRMVDISVTAYFWISLAVLAHLWLEVEPPEPAPEPEPVSVPWAR